ncbi:MAG: carboxypeptidase-like regulatory domain-containing protein, partial [Pedobacter sp.]|nr:carboxypeptidase-like regulatory domain-containing protein [Pedobacter sp.]
MLFRLIKNYMRFTRKLFSEILILSCVCIGLPLANADAQTANEFIIEGVIADEEGKPLPGTSIFISQLKLSTTADKTGHFTLNTKPGKYIIQFSFI